MKQYGLLDYVTLRLSADCTKACNLSQTSERDASFYESLV